MSKIDLFLTPNGAYSTVAIDDVEVRNVRSLKVACAVNAVTTLTLEILALDGIEIHGEAEVKTNETRPDTV